METITTCQICGRAVKSKKGVIAHHGYKRPHEGWQTKSCLGARYLPYELSCDRIPAVIEMVERHITDTQIRLNEFISNPPKTLICQKYKGFGSYENVEVSKPNNFNPNNKNLIYSNTYAYEHSKHKHEMERDIAGSKSTLEYLKDRLNNWVNAS